eukprot:Hpha_TRINITY_DN16193_c1_g6::TRINITY_DN16193_c1_g6_i1::g.3670::m.3670/K11438/PRMT7; type III protein arginine methyltransferase
MRRCACVLLCGITAAVVQPVAAERFIPPGVSNADAGGSDAGSFQRPHLARLSAFSQNTINTVNDWHFAMMNDAPRNVVFEAGLRRVVTPTSVVLDVGAGSGLLSMIAAEAGAAQVFAVEGNPDLHSLSKRIMSRNNLDGVITSINKLSSEITPEDLGGQADVLVSETLGTLLLGESALEYMADARDRLLREGGAVIPAVGTQFATLVSSSKLESLIRARNHGGLDLSLFNELQDTNAVFFTKQLGVRARDLELEEVSPLLELFSVDFYTDTSDTLPRERFITFEALSDATVHAIMYTWEAWVDPEKTLSVSTHPNATHENLPRDMAWGQAMQLVEDHVAARDSNEPGPVPFKVKKGERLELRMTGLPTYSAFYGELRRVGETGSSGVADDVVWNHDVDIDDEGGCSEPLNSEL